MSISSGRVKHVGSSIENTPSTAMRGAQASEEWDTPTGLAFEKEHWSCPSQPSVA